MENQGEQETRTPGETVEILRDKMARTCVAAARGRGGGRGGGRGAAPAGGDVPVVDPVPPVVPNDVAGDAAVPAQPAAVPVPPGAAAAQGIPDVMAQQLLLEGSEFTGIFRAFGSVRDAGVSWGPSGANYQASSQHGGYTASSASVQRPTLDHACFECGEISHIKRYYPRFRQSRQRTQYQTPRAPSAPDRGGKDRTLAGRGGHTAGRGGAQSNRGGPQAGRGGQRPSRGEAQTGNGNRGGSQVTGGAVICTLFQVDQT
ncbi:uncharacterized protein LOC132628694 [Lycium barbarum]|uniref:uncharacterized protein LOC132628694 n=1 Tax=Lycium barbarum TaxID=112863 RepID=UPI00293F6C6D|nr:uncharacterized protein LOC132628694 [Lycium barbarum]